MIELEPWQWAVAGVAALLVGFSKTGIAGLGILIVPLMVEVFPAKESVGALLPMLIVGDVFAVVYYRRHAVWGHLVGLLPWVMGGIALGFVALRSMNSDQLKPALGSLVLVLIGLRLVRHRFGDWFENRLPRAWWFVAGVGVVAGFATMLGNAAGAIMSVYLLAQGLKKREFMGTGAWFYMIVNLVKVPLNVQLGLVSGGSLLFDACVVPAIVVGALVGVRVLPVVPQKVFDRVILVLAAAASVRLIVS